ncbi:bacterial alpha-L-rhamnosidase-domain-containing protein [Kockovaella imperatae]|uniref:Bacterial alpha-L-rhamnosidase-domain-containing protein n=1 Tax=Kockovaella imperatae TaxID=4999 RepID=A0A1Y1UAK0_9TREE|nr:bacterial alpha-L-rhamnosidase-domain-containing protein [Kockovaella imperatae]ORX34105.1 bacterial alpha-L-rhamnosidase-domain-containing protein [Kockovaella imperatae]
MDPAPSSQTIAHLNDNWTWVKDWIDAPLKGEAGRLARFQRIVEVEAAALKVPIWVRLSADTRYKLLINGNRVCVGPARGSDRIWFYDTIDLGPFLRTGSNIIEILVLRFFPSENVAEPFGRTARPGLTIYGSIGDENISTGGTDTKWLGGPEDNRYYPQETPWDHFLNTYEETSSRTEEVALSPLKRHRLWNKQGVLSPWFLEPRCIPLAEETPCPFKAIRHSDSGLDIDAWHQLIAGRAPLTLPKGSKHRLELEFQVHSTAFISVTAERPKYSGSKVSLTYSEAYEVLPRPPPGQGFTFKDDRTQREGHGLVGPSDSYFFSGYAGGGDRTESYEPFWWKTFRFIVLEIEVSDEPLTLESLVFTQTTYPMAVVADWKATPLSNKMWDVSIRTMRNCMFDGYSDCPFYEQLQYGEDSRSAMVFHYLLSGDDRLGKQAISAFATSIQPHGLLLARYPAHTKQVITGFSLFWSMQVCDHMLYFNEPDFANRFLPTIDSVFGFFDRQTDPSTGLVANLPRRFWSFIDWNVHWGSSDVPKGFHDNGMPMEGRESGTWSFFTMIYAFTLRRVCTLLQQLGKPQQIAQYTSRADRAVSAIKQYCYDGEFFMDSTVEAHRPENPLSQVSQIWGILCGAIDPSSPDARRILLKAFDPQTEFAVASYVMQHYAFRVLSHTGLYNMFYHRMWDKWRLQLDKNLSTWEEDDVNGRSDCHEWSALHPYEYLTEVAGLKPLAPGWQVVYWNPRWKLYETIVAKVALGHQGVAQVSWRTTESVCEVSLSLPRELRVYSPGVHGNLVDRGVVDRLSLSFPVKD